MAMASEDFQQFLAQLKPVPVHVHKFQDVKRYMRDWDRALQENLERAREAEEQRWRVAREARRQSPYMQSVIITVGKGEKS